MLSTQNDEKRFGLNVRYRELIQILIKYNPPVVLYNSIKNDGDIQFSVPLKNIGINNELYLKYRDVIFSDFIANFLGELLVRENIEEFSVILTNKIDAEDYPQLVNTYEHHQFGMEINGCDLVFSFHISLLQSILTESFKKRLHNN
jgi:hypothetical protein